jgi:hypothetical protein
MLTASFYAFFIKTADNERKGKVLYVPVDECFILQTIYRIPIKFVITHLCKNLLKEFNNDSSPVF